MSNIIDGISYGMGYEKTDTWSEGLQFFRKSNSTWVGSEAEMDDDMDHRLVYRRPLPIISQHPGAIPLEPGEEIEVGGRYLCRNGKIFTIPRDEGHWWHASGESMDFEDFDIIARLPKVEKKEEEKMATVSPEYGGGVYQPKSGSAIYEGKVEPEKSKEEKVEEKEIELTSCHHYTKLKGAKQFITMTEAARIAQLPQVIAEVERQRKEKEIKVGDWAFDKQSGAYFKVKEITPLGLQVCISRTRKVMFADRNECTKITDPAFIALLKKGVGNG